MSTQTEGRGSACVPRRDPVVAWLWLQRQAGHHRVGKPITTGEEGCRFQSSSHFHRAKAAPGENTCGCPGTVPRSTGAVRIPAPATKPWALGGDGT